MHFKLIIALVDERQTKDIMLAAREAGATGATVVGAARGEGLEPKKTFFGMNLEAQRDMLMFIVEEHLSRQVLEHIAAIGGFEDNPGSGLAFQLDVEDTIGLRSQIEVISEEVEEEI
ncbi:MAG: transcriptional regulator [Zetaproteobacteria bacterium CG12_big_fil_rev_8_21_14_0_65_55_1124]|nr:MAG: transcriptional regulator [Zetaproteobacteria bacterium CG1_02_55_237]PIS18566.1 MAG: transcriptional regulator [Zetaproteobacteria bacterium CG08_land_8_20_14_0_20_55_17]PIW42042.1 MAG: transcriptional regulator [Zetaproteobacteria bacterium CG12_big_fil_rev_8_21_14_0_65_55_1124]PIY53948.1 MAG: transcriptional regulator [Zetaproteobacteria bacterium CG_4_10_14_0_8_um_filter_55_43]PIZ39393.1 MAG: transcriptional regulator [Zetaproteobacteria bacterium CG_4_10_14_0_2_um_filter_55_20]PJB